MTETCITEGIWHAALAEGHNLATAQGRAALDRRLRSELAEIEDTSLRSHAAEILRQKRAKAFPDDHGDSLDGILRRLRRIVDALGFGRDDRPLAALMERG